MKEKCSLFNESNLCFICQLVMSHFTIYKSRKGLPALFDTDSFSSQFNEDIADGKPLFISFPPFSVYVTHSYVSANANTETEPKKKKNHPILIVGKQVRNADEQLEHQPGIHLP